MSLANNPGQVITPEKLALLVAEAWPTTFTPVNIMAGFKKAGVHPLNPGVVSDRQIAHSKVYQRLYILRNRDRKRHIKFQFPRKPMRVVKINFCGLQSGVKKLGRSWYQG